MTRTKLLLIAVLVVALVIGWWMLEGKQSQPDRTDMFDVTGDADAPQ